MVKYTTAILFLAAAVFCSSVSAKPHHVSEEGDDAQEIANFINWGLRMANAAPNNRLAKLRELLYEAKDKKWDSAVDFYSYIAAASSELNVEDDENSRKKRELIEDESEENNEVSQKKSENEQSSELIQMYVNDLLFMAYAIKVAPSQYQEDLKTKFTDLFVTSLDNDEDPTEGIFRVFEEVTGQDLDTTVVENLLDKTVVDERDDE